jgi:hypothetical protein
LVYAIWHFYCKCSRTAELSIDTRHDDNIDSRKHILCWQNCTCKGDYPEEVRYVPRNIGWLSIVYTAIYPRSSKSSMSMK